MGVFQSGINNILAQAGVATKFASDTIRENKKAKMEQQKADEDKKMAEAQKIEAEQQAEQQELLDLQNKVDEAIQMSIGYSPKEIKTQKARSALGLEPTNKNPRGVSQQTHDRRYALGQSMKEIIRIRMQDKDYAQRLKSLSTEEISLALNKEIRKKKKIKGSEINVEKK